MVRNPRELCSSDSPIPMAGEEVQYRSGYQVGRVMIVESTLSLVLSYFYPSLA